MKDKPKAMYIHFTIHQFSTASTSALNMAKIDFIDKMGHLFE